MPRHPKQRNKKPKWKSARVPFGQTGFRGNQLMIGKIMQCVDAANSPKKKGDSK